jgi:hypothetical protein
MDAKLEWTKGVFGAYYCDIENFHISLSRNIKSGHYDKSV